MLPLIVLSADFVPRLLCSCGAPAIFLHVCGRGFEGQPLVEAKCGEHLPLAQDEPRLVVGGEDLGAITARGEG